MDKTTAFDRRVLWLGLVPALVYGAHNLVIVAVQEPGPALAIANDAAREAAALRFRYLWVAAFAVSFSASVAVGIGALMMVVRYLGGADRRFALGLAALAFMLVVLAELFATGPRWYVFMGPDFFRQALCGTAQGGPVQPSCQLDMLDLGLDLVKYAGAFALILLTLAFAATLGRRGTDDRAEGAVLAAAARDQDALLYRGAVVYVLACVSLIAWMYWPMPYLADADAKARYHDLMLGAAVLQGVGYSLGIASIFLPAAFLLQNRIERLRGIAQDGNDSEPPAWLAAIAARGNPMDQLRKTAMLLLPTFTSFLPALDNLWN